ncbi:hypothetical protein [Peptostreptococcus porci]|uniref:hypothetical protein n=1 Tax=Peptostreptococcus porci TaxID=2652282 RepID=UPI002A7FBD38|nr:hypothetical protein [Peptostreptococcus porci]MDY4128815.1 hypothetical protein [Peptostreptococcus porci]MDY5437161.1 hypothetical protein [Peptostreptococcus porci]MDY6232796.1 hypothetical protein [Peptostreptococcus porci]
MKILSDLAFAIIMLSIVLLKPMLFLISIMIVGDLIFSARMRKSRAKRYGKNNLKYSRYKYYSKK